MVAQKTIFFVLLPLTQLLFRFLRCVFVCACLLAALRLLIAHHHQHHHLYNHFNIPPPPLPPPPPLLPFVFYYLLVGLIWIKNKRKYDGSLNHKKKKQKKKTGGKQKVTVDTAGSDVAMMSKITTNDDGKGWNEWKIAKIIHFVVHYTISHSLSCFFTVCWLAGIIYRTDGANLWQ